MSKRLSSYALRELNSLCVDLSPQKKKRQEIILIDFSLIKNKASIPLSCQIKNSSILKKLVEYFTQQGVKERKDGEWIYLLKFQSY